MTFDKSLYSSFRVNHKKDLCELVCVTHSFCKIAFYENKVNGANGVQLNAILILYNHVNIFFQLLRIVLDIV